MARQVVIENLVLNSPYREPARHFRFDDDGITSEVVAARRPSSYFVPIAAARRRGGQLAFQTKRTADWVEENAFISQVRERVGRWRQGGWPHVTPTTRRLLEFWMNPERERPLFFCQVEALETAIHLAEAPFLSATWSAPQLINTGPMRDTEMSSRASRRKDRGETLRGIVTRAQEQLRRHA